LSFENAALAAKPTRTMDRSWSSAIPLARLTT
jgi:hypothetical protein